MNRKKVPRVLKRTFKVFQGSWQSLQLPCSILYRTYLVKKWLNQGGGNINNHCLHTLHPQPCKRGSDILFHQVLHQDLQLVPLQVSQEAGGEQSTGLVGDQGYLAIRLDNCPHCWLNHPRHVLPGGPQEQGERSLHHLPLCHYLCGEVWYMECFQDITDHSILLHPWEDGEGTVLQLRAHSLVGGKEGLVTVEIVKIHPGGGKNAGGVVHGGDEGGQACGEEGVWLGEYSAW